MIQQHLTYFVINWIGVLRRRPTQEQFTFATRGLPHYGRRTLGIARGETQSSYYPYLVFNILSNYSTAFLSQNTGHCHKVIAEKLV